MEKEIEVEQNFKRWADAYFIRERLNVYLPIYDIVKDFREKSPFSYWSDTWLKQELEKWCIEKKYEMNPKESLNERGNCRDYLQKCTVEMIVIKAENPVVSQFYLNQQLQVMGKEFKEWADNYFTPEMFRTYIPKTAAFLNFEIESNEQKWTSSRFKTALKCWANYNGYVLNPESELNSQGRCVKIIDGKSIEMIFIKENQA